MTQLKTAWLWVGLALTILTVGAVQASAQQARTFDQLQMLVERGDRITDTESTGTVTNGSIFAAQGSSRNITIRPVLTEDRKGLLVSWSF